MTEPIAAQGSPEWLIERLGHATASEFSAVCAKGKTPGSEAVTRRAYRIRLASERLTGKPNDSYFANNHMQRGQRQEPFARMAYETRTGLLAVEVPFRRHPTLAYCGASPDGEVETDGTVEVKAVLPHIQIETILGGKCPAEHAKQVQGGLWVTGRQWCDFISYSPDLPGSLSLCVYRVARDEEIIAKIEAEVRLFLEEVDALCARLLRLAA